MSLIQLAVARVKVDRTRQSDYLTEAEVWRSFLRGECRVGPPLHDTLIFMLC